MNVIFKYIKAYFIKWYLPILSNLLVLFIFILGYYFQRDWIINLGLLTFYANLVGTIISGIVQIFIRKWYFLLLQYTIAGGLFFLILMLFLLSPPDFYGVHKTLPEEIHFYNPLSQEPNEKEFEQHDLILMHSSQPGIYMYFTDHIPQENGDFYIKAYEITSNDRLSGAAIKERSKVRFDSTSEPILYGEFTIYEGSWGDLYGSRIELWFQPSNGSPDYKVTERYYIVEGWMR